MWKFFFFWKLTYSLRNCWALRIIAREASFHSVMQIFLLNNLTNSTITFLNVSISEQLQNTPFWNVTTVKKVCILQLVCAGTTDTLQNS
jgi:hypothetical protein